MFLTAKLFFVVVFGLLTLRGQIKIEPNQSQLSHIIAITLFQQQPKNFQQMDSLS